MKKVYFSIIFTILIFYFQLSAQLGLWTSVEELADKTISGAPWNWVKNAADAADPDKANVSDQNSNNNVEIFAAGIVYTRTGIKNYKDKVVSAVEKLIREGEPPELSSDVLPWARETGAYALAADLVSYRTSEFEAWLRSMVEVWEGAGNETMLAMYKRRPNNHGTQAFGSLVSVYAYLQDSLRLREIRDYWIQGVTGPNPGYTYGGPDNDFSWHVDSEYPLLINPKGAVKEGLDIDGIMPDDIRRNGSFSNPPPPATTPYHWEGRQGIIVAARIFERIGMPIWDVADSAIYRAFHVLEVRWEGEFGGWAASGDDEWMLPFVDAAYGSNFSRDQKRLWDHGKSAGWGYVVWNPETSDVVDEKLPKLNNLFQNYPNLFNPETNIFYSLSQSRHASLIIYDIMGRIVSTLINGFKDAGNYNFMWKAEDNDGQRFPNGIYLCCLQSDNSIETIKMMLTR